MRRYFVVRTNERLTNRQLKRDLKLSAEFFGRAFRALISVSHENSKCMGNMRETCNIVARSKRRSEEHTSELQSRLHLVCRLLLEKKKDTQYQQLDASCSRCCAQILPCV